MLYNSFVKLVFVRIQEKGYKMKFDNMYNFLFLFYKMYKIVIFGIFDILYKTDKILQTVQYIL